MDRINVKPQMNALDEAMDNYCDPQSLMMYSMPPIINSEYGSENESETSSFLSSGPKQTELTPKHSAVRFEPDSQKTRAIRTGVTIKRAVSLPRTSIQPTTHLTPSKREVFSRNSKTPMSSTISNKMPMSPPVNTVQARSQSKSSKPQKPNSLPHVQSRSCKPQTVVSSSIKSVKRGTVGATNLAVDNTSLRIRSNILSVELKSMTSSMQSPYGTIPRRRKQKSAEDLLDGSAAETRSSSVSCDSRMTSSLSLGTRKQLQLSGSGSNSSSAWTTPTQPQAGGWPSCAALYNSKHTAAMASRRSHTMSKSQRTRIYYEQSVQTELTSEDFCQLLRGEYAVRSGHASSIGAKLFDRETQCSDIRDAELDQLRGELCALNATLQRERQEKSIMQRELQLNTERVMEMLEMARISTYGGSSGGGGGWTPTSEEDASSCSASGNESRLMFDSQVQLCGNELVERQQEIRQLRQLCRSLQSEMQRSVTTQQYLLQEKAAIEQESNELQDFLQHEKTAMYDALHELEGDFEACKSELASREEDVRLLREKCRYLVRLNEQRRQENLFLQTKLSTFHTRSKNLITQQNSALSSASNALSKLYMRLESLVDELKLTYNISELDLENPTLETDSPKEVDPKTQTIDREQSNEHGAIESYYSHDRHLGVSATDGYNENLLSQQRHQSFVAAIISGIRGAAISSKRSMPTPEPSTECRISVSNIRSVDSENMNGYSKELIDTSDMLDSETEPCLMMENVIEDVKISDIMCKNKVVSPIASDSELQHVLNSEVTADQLSLNNLSEAILNRQYIEMQANNAITDDTSNCLALECPDLEVFIDKICDVDTLVTCMLRLIHAKNMDSDSYIQQLIVDKNKLEQNQNEMLEKLCKLQEANIKLQDDLIDATNELPSKSELQPHHNEIDDMRLTCPGNRKLSAERSGDMFQTAASTVDLEVMEVMDILNKWQNRGDRCNEPMQLISGSDAEGNITDSSPDYLWDRRHHVDSQDNLDAEVRQTIMKLEADWRSLSLSASDFIDPNANPTSLVGAQSKSTETTGCESQD